MRGPPQRGSAPLPRGARTMMGRRTGLMAAAALVLGVMSAGASAKEPPVRASCARITEKQVEALFDRWNRALATKNPDTVVANYAPDATLLPTVKNGPLIGRRRSGVTSSISWRSRRR